MNVAHSVGARPIQDRRSPQFGFFQPGRPEQHGGRIAGHSLGDEVSRGEERLAVCRALVELRAHHLGHQGALPAVPPVRAEVPRPALRLRGVQFAGNDLRSGSCVPGSFRLGVAVGVLC